MKNSFFFLFLAPVLAIAQQQKRTPVYFECTCDDSVGSLYATRFRDLLASSPRYRQVSFNKDGWAEAKNTYWHVSVVSLDENEGNPGNHSALGVVILLGNDIFIDQSTQVCGQSKVDVCASTTFAFLDKQVDKFSSDR